MEMFLNVGGAVLGVAVLTVINDSVTSNNGGKGNSDAALDGYRAGYYGAIAMAAIGLICSIFFTQPKKDEVKSQSEHPECPDNNSQQPSSDGPSKEEHPQKPLSIT